MAIFTYYKRDYGVDLTSLNFDDDILAELFKVEDGLYILCFYCIGLNEDVYSAIEDDVVERLIKEVKEKGGVKLLVSRYTVSCDLSAR